MGFTLPPRTSAEPRCLSFSLSRVGYALALVGACPGFGAHLLKQDRGVDRLGEDVKHVTLRSSDREKINSVMDARDE